MNNQKFLFLFNAILLNASEHPERQARLLLQAIKQGRISAPAAITLWQTHNIKCNLKDLNEAYGACLSTPAPDPGDQLDRQQIPEPPAEFEQDPMNPCGALDPRF